MRKLKMKEEISYSEQKIMMIKMLLSFFIIIPFLGMLIAFFQNGFSILIILPASLLCIFGFFYFFILKNLKPYHLSMEKEEIIIDNEIIRLQDVMDYKKIFQDRGVLLVKYNTNSQQKTAILISPEKIKDNSFYPTRLKPEFTSSLEQVLKSQKK